MKQTIRNTIKRMSAPFPFTVLRRLCRHRIIFPFYHLVCDNIPPHARYLYPVCSIDRFRSDLQFLLSHYKKASMNDIQKWANGEKPPLWEQCFFLTFDDGLREMYDVVAPILSENGLQAAFFVNPAFVGNKQLFYRHKISLILIALNNSPGPAVTGEVTRLLNSRRHGVNLHQHIQMLTWNDNSLIDQLAEALEINFSDYLEKFQPYLTLDQLRQLKDRGFLIGSHSYDHPLFSDVDEQEMKNQVTESTRFLQKHLQPDHQLFAFPFTDDGVNKNFFEWMFNQANIDFSFGTAGLKNDIFNRHLQRVPMEIPGYHSAKQILKAEYFYYFAKVFTGKNKISRK